MSDQITAVQANADGSYVFSFLFDSGTGITGSCSISLPAPQGTQAVAAVTDGNGNIITPAVAAVAAVPYTLETAKAAVLPLALAQKANWMAAISGQTVIGAVTL